VIKIYNKKTGKEELIAQGSSNYTRYVQFDNKIYWERTQPNPQTTPEPLEVALPSSSIRRKELALIFEKKFAEADKLNNESSGAVRVD